MFDYKSQGISEQKANVLEYFASCVEYEGLTEVMREKIASVVVALSKQLFSNNIDLKAWVSERLPQISDEVLIGDLLSNVHKLNVEKFGIDVANILRIAFIEKENPVSLTIQRLVNDYNNDVPKIKSSVKSLAPLLKGCSFPRTFVYLVSHVKAESYGSAFVVPSSFIKVGITCDVDRRLAELRNRSGKTVMLLATIECLDKDDASEIEALLHGRLSTNRMAGEWFECNPREVFNLMTTYNVTQYEWRRLVDVTSARIME